ncbi:hypothetical protein KM043_000628 [Ampulex compressa]|nr:hypothetical protein KM043_000628 [Ampulex compressa]
MKVSVDCTILSFFVLAYRLAETDADDRRKMSDIRNNRFSKRHEPRFISFNSGEDKVEINWDVSIPFISIPLKQEIEEGGKVSPLLNVNTKALGVAGLVVAILAFIVPLFSKTPPESYYRSSAETEWSNVGNMINGLIFSNAYVGPCLQRIVCSMVAGASNAENPSSTEKIIDGLSGHEWFNRATNGTIVQEAVSVAKEGNQDCSRVYKNCLITPRLLKDGIRAIRAPTTNSLTVSRKRALIIPTRPVRNIVACTVPRF